MCCVCVFTTSAANRRPDSTACAAQIRTAFFTQPRLSQLTIGTRVGCCFPSILVYVCFYVHFCRFSYRFKTIAEFSRPHKSVSRERVGSTGKSTRDEEKIYCTRSIIKKSSVVCITRPLRRQHDRRSRTQETHVKAQAVRVRSQPDVE